MGKALALNDVDLSAEEAIANARQADDTVDTGAEPAQPESTWSSWADEDLPEGVRIATQLAAAVGEEHGNGSGSDETASGSTVAPSEGESGWQPIAAVAPEDDAADVPAIGDEGEARAAAEREEDIPSSVAQGEPAAVASTWPGQSTAASSTDRRVEPRARGGISAIGATLLVLLGALLGSALSLGTIYYMNGTFSFANQNQMSAAFARIDAVNGQVSGQMNDLNASLQTATGRLSTAEGRMDDTGKTLTALAQSLSAVGARLGEVDGLKDQVAQTVSQIDQVNGNLTKLTGDFTELNTAFGDVSNKAVRFDGFLNDLSTILQKAGK